MTQHEDRPHLHWLLLLRLLSAGSCSSLRLLAREASLFG